MEKSKVLDMIKSGVTEVVFTKKDGSKRHMTCTLNEELLPTQLNLDLGDDPKPKKKENPDVLAVFDTASEAWRSFRWDSLLTVSGESFVLGKE